MRTTGKHFSQGKVIAFRVISIFVPFFLLLLVEMALRLSHYGSDLSVFIEYPQDKSFLYFNPEASKRYFSNQRNATTGNVEPFKKKKETGTFRIFVLGESTTIGYPYFHNGSFHRWLQYRLTHEFPDRKFEVINISLTAVNSYTVAGFAKEVVHYEPDAVLIYTGHNEYYGALGIGSTENIGGNPLLIQSILRLREFKITQLLTNFYDSLTKTSSPDQGRDGTRMQRMVAEQKIPFQSELYKSGVRQFELNIDKTLKLFSAKNIPVFISNLVSNEKDLKPFVSFPVESAQYPAFNLNYKLGVKAIKDKRYSSAFRFFKAANNNFSENAQCNYYLGKLSYALKKYDEAKIYFSKARDLDGLRFRAPDTLNTLLSNLTQKYTNVHMVDTKKVFERHSAHQIIGDELILEHVHPNLTGYALMSETFYNAIKNTNILGKPALAITFDKLLKKMPVTAIDSLSGIYKVTHLKSSWPFKGTMRLDSSKVVSFEEKLAFGLANRKISWLDAQEQAYSHYIQIHDLEKARKTVETLVLEYPVDAQYYLKSAMLSGEMKDEESAVFNFKKAFVLAPAFEIARYLFVIYLKLDKPSEAIPYLDYAIANNTSRFDLTPVRASVLKIGELKKILEKDSANKFILSQIAGLYLKMDNKHAVSKYASIMLKLDPADKTARNILSDSVQ